MSDFDCSKAACETPAECLERDACLSLPERNELARNDRVKQIIAATRRRLHDGPDAA